MLDALFELKDSFIRRIATSFIFRFLDNKKTEVARVVQAVNMILTGCYLLCGFFPASVGFDACAVVDVVNLKWVLLGSFVGHLGLEFGIQDANAKERLAKKA
jgi:hypothetical protein